MIEKSNYDSAWWKNLNKELEKENQQIFKLNQTLSKIISDHEINENKRNNNRDE